jgi:N-acetylglutamate synthase-like GNAT family acetyltransferase
MMERLKCTVRAARDDDRGKLVLLAEETLQPLAAGAGHPERYCSADLLSLLERAEAFVAEADDETVGFMAAEENDDVLAVRCVTVSPAFEARGVAHQLLDWAEGLAIERRLARLEAWVPATDAPSRHLFTGHGFVTAAVPGDPELLLFEKRLPVFGA